MNVNVYRFTALIICFLLCVSAPVQAKRIAPTEVLSDVSIVKIGGVNAIKINFAIPVHYVSHTPTKQGNDLKIQLRFNKRELPDVSQLPLLQSMTPRTLGVVPLDEVVYITENETPTLDIKFTQTVKWRVSQLKGLTSLFVFLPETEAKTAKAAPKLPAAEIPSLDKKMSPEKLEKIMRAGKKALTEGDNSTAVQIFSALLSLPPNKYSEESLELLGVARQRNGQLAHAKSIYNEYLEKYPKSKSRGRIKQRLAELDQDRNQPQEPLKKGKEAKKSKRATSSYFLGSFGQYLDYSESNSEQTGFRRNYAAIDNYLFLSHRRRTPDNDWRNVLVGSYSYDTVDGETKGFQPNKLYTRYKSVQSGWEGTLGRHRSRVPGVIGRFDGVSLGKQTSDNTQLNLVMGYPVKFSDKRAVQTNKRFLVASWSLDEVWKGWDISPFVAKQTTDGQESRSAWGSDLRFYHDKGDVYAFAEYDEVFGEWTSNILQTKYSLGKHTEFNLSYSKQKNIDLENSLNAFTVDTLKDVLDQTDVTIDELTELAKNKTGESESVTFNMGHDFSDVLSVNLWYTQSKETSVDLVKSINPNGTTVPLDPNPTRDDLLNAVLYQKTVDTKDTSIQLLTSNSFVRNDNTILHYQLFNHEDFDFYRIYIDYQRPILKRSRVSSRLEYRARDENKGDTLRELSPKVKITYRKFKNVKLDLELKLIYREETEVFSGSTIDDTSTEFLLYGGYTWDF